MVDLLTVSRTRDGRTSHTTLAAIDVGAFSVSSGDEVVYVDAPDALAAVAACPRLHTVDGEELTELVRHTPALLPPAELIAALRPTQHAIPLDEEAEEELYGMEEPWRTWHEVRLDGQPLYGVEVDGRVVLIDAVADQRRPHEDWVELLATFWDSSTYSAVGMSGYGGSGVYLVRPGLLAVVSWSDEHVAASFQEVPVDAKPRELAIRHGMAAVQSDQDVAMLEEAAYGRTELEIHEGSAFASILTARELRVLLHRGE